MAGHKEKWAPKEEPSTSEDNPLMYIPDDYPWQDPACWFTNDQIDCMIQCLPRELQRRFKEMKQYYEQAGDPTSIRSEVEATV